MIDQFLAVIAVTAAGLTTSEEPPFETALLRSVELCSREVAGGEDLDFPVDIYPNLPADLTRRGDVKSAADVPDLIHRFAATTRSGRVGWQGDFLKVPSAEGGIWAVSSGSMPLCDVAVTGLVQPPAPPRALVEHLQSEGWSLVAEHGADETVPLWQFVLQKPAPTSETSNRIVRVTIQGIRVGSSPDGIQMDLSFVAGQLRSN